MRLYRKALQAVANLSWAVGSAVRGSESVAPPLPEPSPRETKDVKEDDKRALEFKIMDWPTYQKFVDETVRPTHRYYFPEWDKVNSSIRNNSKVASTEWRRPDYRKDR